jgi:putative DNA methylase
MAIEQKFDVPFVASLALREKQIQQVYRPSIAVHKWFGCNLFFSLGCAA